MTRNRALAAVILLTLLGFALRVYALDQVPFRGDEAFTVLNWITPPLGATLASDIPTRDPQPPLAYAVFWGWGQLTGTSELAMRLLPALAGTLGIPLLYALGARLHSRQMGALAALLWAIHPHLIWHAQDARNYALWSALSAAALWLALRALAHQRRRDWALYVLAAAAAAYMYYLELFVLVALNLFVAAAYWRRWAALRRWIVAQGLIALLLAPWFLQERLLVSSGYTGTTYSAEFARLFDWFLPALTFGETLPTPLAAFAWPLIALALALGLLAWWRQCRRCALLLLLLGAVPPLLLTLVSLRLDVFTPRYVLASTPAYTLMLAGLVILAPVRVTRTPAARRALASGLLVALVAVSSASLAVYYFDYAKAPDWRALAAHLHERVDPDNSLVIQTAADEAFTYYFRGWSDLQRLPANPGQPDREIAAVLEADRQQYQNIWLVANPSPDWPNASTSAEWLESHMQLIRADSVAGLPARHFMPWQVDPAELAGGSIQFGSAAELLGVRLLDEPADAGRLVLLAYWQPLADTDSNLKVFVHLVPAATPTAAPAAQDDQFLQDGRISTRRWSGTERFRDVYTLALESLPAGTYSLFIGLYDPATGARTLLADGSDRYHIGDITLPQP